MNKKTILIVLGTTLYLALAIVLIVTIRAFSLRALLHSTAIGSIVVGTLVLVGTVLALLVWGAKEGGGGIRGGSLIFLALAGPVYYAMQEYRAEYPIGHAIAVSVLVLLQLALSVYILSTTMAEIPRSRWLPVGLLAIPLCLFAGTFCVVLVRASWAFMYARYSVWAKIGVGLVNALWALAFVAAPPIVVELLADQDQ